MVYNDNLAQVIARQESILSWNFYSRVSNIFDKGLLDEGEDFQEEEEEFDFYVETELDI